MTLTEFLLARIAEDEAVAREATQGRWAWQPPSEQDWATGDQSLVSFTDEAEQKPDNYFGGCSAWLREVAGTVPTGSGHTHPVSDSVLYGWGYDASGIEARDEDRAHIPRHDPARVLAECEAKRQIVETADAAEQAFDVGADLHLHQTGRIGAYRRVLSLLALPYADHPDYRDEWKP